MKKTIIFAALAAATLTVTSCADHYEMEALVNDGLILTLDSGEMETRADDGASSMETKINHFDFFFFEDAEGTKPIPKMHGRA